MVASALSIGMLGILPTVGFGSHMIFNRILGPKIEGLALGELPAKPLAYVMVQGMNETCIHEVDGKGNARGIETEQQWAKLPTVVGSPTFDAKRIVGRSFIAHDRSRAFGTVLHVYSLDGAPGNHAALRATQGDIGRAPLTVLCGFEGDLPRARAR